MSNDKNAYPPDYNADVTSTNADASLVSGNKMTPTIFEVQPVQYEIAKPKRIIIRGKIIDG